MERLEERVNPSVECQDSEDCNGTCQATNAAGSVERMVLAPSFGRRLRVIATVQDPLAVQAILAHLKAFARTLTA